MKNSQNNNYSLRDKNQKKIVSIIKNSPKFTNFFLKKMYLFLEKNKCHLDHVIGSEVFENSFFKSNILRSILKIHFHKRLLINKDFSSHDNTLTFNEKLLLNTKKNNTILIIRNFFEDKVSVVLLFLKILIFKNFSPKNINKNEEENSLLFVSYIPQSNFLLNKNNFKSYHWNDIPNLLGKNAKKNYFHLYPLDKEHLNLLIKRTFCSSKIKKNISNHFFFLNFISYKTIFMIFIKSILRIDTTKKKNHLDFYFSKIFSSRSYFDSMLWKKVFFNFFNKHNTFKKSFYLFENQPWEKYFYYYNNFYVNNRIYAYNHSPSRKMDYRVYTSIFFSKIKNYKKYFPSEILVNDDISFKNIKSFDSSFKLVKVESPENKLKINIADNKRVFILGDVSIANSKKIIDITLQLKEKKIIKNFIFKPHPSNKNFFLKKYKKINFFLDPLNKYNKKIKYIFCTNSTTAAVRFAETKAQILVFVPDGNINLSPLNGYYKNIFFNDFESLLNLLNIKKKIKKKSIYFRGIKMKKWKKLK